MLLLLALVMGVQSQMFFDKVMGYNAKAQQFLDQKQSESPAYPQKPLLKIEVLHDIKENLEDAFAYKAVVGMFVKQANEVVESFKESEMMDVQFSNDAETLYSKRTTDLKWKDERVHKDYQNYLQESDIITSRLAQNNNQLDRTRVDIDDLVKRYDQQLAEQAKHLANLLSFKQMMLDAIESGAQKDYFAVLALVKEHVNLGSFTGRRKNPLLPALFAQVDRFLTHPNFEHDKTEMTSIFSLLLNYLSETQITMRESEMETMMKKAEQLASLNSDVSSYESADRSHKEHMKMIKDRQITMNDEIQLVQRNIRELEKQVLEFKDQSDKLWRIEDESLYYLRESKKQLGKLHNDYI